MGLVVINCATVLWRRATYVSTSCGSLRLRQVYVEVASHQQLIPAGPPDDGRDNVLYGRGIIGGDVPPHDIILLLYHHYLEYDDVWDVEEERLKGEALHLVVEDGNASAIWYQLLGRRHPVPHQLSYVTPPPPLKSP